MKKSKIGIMTYYAVQNFGAALQAFALQQNVERFGANAEFLRFFDKHNESLEIKTRSIVSLMLHNKQMRANLLHFARFLRIKRFTNPNKIAFADFQKQYLHTTSEPYYDIEDLRLANNRYNGFIAGSDMVWTPIGQDLGAYFLDFADKEKRFSYAPSMTGCHTFSKENADNIKKYLQCMNIISCRENEGIDYVKATTGREATLVVDPTLLFSKEAWRKELNITSLRPTKPYILCYNFGGLTKSIKSEVYRIAKERNMDVRYVPLSHEEADEELKLGHKGPYGPREFVELFLNASFIVTNTFHGFLFSLISENPFVVIRRENGNTWKPNETRISNLMDMIDVSERYIEFDVRIDDKFLSLDYGKINEIISTKRKESLTYLKRVVETACKNQLGSNEQILTNIRDLSIKQCTGCSLCFVICPFGAIKMIENDEGFVVPKVDNNKCKECGKCAKMCPSVNPLKKNNPIATKLCLSKDKLVDKSASGGLFITIAKYVVEHLSGVVYGVIMDSDFTCRHAEATTVGDLIPMQNSKYVQSIIGDCFDKAKKRLDEGKYVLFSGAPCQIAALKSYLKKDYETLITMDLVCHGVPNQRFWKKYIQEGSKKNKIITYTFRTRGNRKIDKTSLEATVCYDKFNKQRPFATSAYYGSFIRNESFRFSCYYCQYARPQRLGDITMGDCDSEKRYLDFYPYESKSICLINSSKGELIWNAVKGSFEHTYLNYQEEIKANTCLGHPSVIPYARQQIYADLEKLSWKDFTTKYVHKSVKLKQLLRFLYTKLC